MIKSYSTEFVKSDSTILMIPLPVTMAERKQRPGENTVYIDETDRKAILARMEERSIKNTDLATACVVSKSAITLLLKGPIPKNKTRGCRFGAKLQAALGLTLAPKRPASAVPVELQRRADRVMKALRDDRAALEHWLRNGEWEADKKKGGS